MTQDSDSNNYLKVQCHVCETKIDVSELEAFTQINCPSCSELITVPRILDHYLLEEELGRNACYKTYKASDLRLHRTVVVKLLNEEFRDNEKVVERFFKHAGRIALLNHPSLTPIYSSGKEDGESFVVSQYLDFNSLESYFELKGKKVKLYKSCYILRSVAEALKATWQYDLGHYNLNLRNIVFDNDGHINVCDFGFSKLLFDEAKAKELVAYFSPEYIAPEIVESQDFSELSDIYSFGIIAYQLFTGELPFVDIKPQEQMNLRLGRELVSPNLINKNLPDEFAQFCLSLTYKDKTKRTQSFDDVLRKLTRLMEELFDGEEFSSSSDQVKVTSPSPAVAKEPVEKETSPVAIVNMTDMFVADAKEDKGYAVTKKIAMALYYIFALFIMPPLVIVLVCWLSLKFAPDSMLSERVRDVLKIESSNSETVTQKPQNEASSEVEANTKGSSAELLRKKDEALARLVDRPKPQALNFFKARTDLANYYAKLPTSIREKVKAQVIYLLKSRKHFQRRLNTQSFKTEITRGGQKYTMTLTSVDRNIFKFYGEFDNYEVGWNKIHFNDLKRLVVDSIKNAEKASEKLSDEEKETLNKDLDKCRFHLALFINWYELSGLDEVKLAINDQELKDELEGLL